MFGEFLMYYALFVAINGFVIEIMSIGSKNRKWQDIGFNMAYAAILLFVIGIVARLINL